MFVKAIEIASNFTWPLVISYRTLGGPCYCRIGTLVVVNPDGWFVTAGHNIRILNDIARECDRNMARAVALEEINSDKTLDREAKRQKINELGALSHKSADIVSPLWGKPGIQGKDIIFSQRLKSRNDDEDVLDLAVGRLDPFDPKEVASYPTFKDPSKDFKPGKLLCKMGYPFNKLKVTWNAEMGTFDLPGRDFPLSGFPIEGMLTRIIPHELLPGIADTVGYPIISVETSTPGLKGQSGGPTVDNKATVWAIQSRTKCIPLGYDAPIPDRPKHTETQFLNLGIGVHTSTLFGFFKDCGVDFRVSDY